MEIVSLGSVYFCLLQVLELLFQVFFFSLFFPRTDVMYKRNLWKWHNQKPLRADYASKNESSVCLSLLVLLLQGRKDVQWKRHLSALLVWDTNRKTALFCLQLSMSSVAGKFKSTALKGCLLIKYIIMLVVIHCKFLAESESYPLHPSCSRCSSVHRSWSWSFFTDKTSDCKLAFEKSRIEEGVQNARVSDTQGCDPAG